MITHAVILAGGRGTRLGTLTDSCPKPLLPVGGKPFLDLHVRHLKSEGIRSVTVIAGYLGEMIGDYFAQNPVAGCSVEVLIEPEPMGTGGALRFAGDVLPEAFFLLNGDTFFDVPLARLARGVDGSIACLAVRKADDPGRYGVIRRTGDRLTGFAARAKLGQTEPAEINGGIYALNHRVIDYIGEGFVSFENEVMPQLVARERVTCLPFDDAFIDIGIVEDLNRADTLINDTLTRPALFLGRDGVLNEDVKYLHRPEDVIWIAGACETIAWATECRVHVFVVTNQAGVARGYYDEAAVHSLHGWMADQVFANGGRITDFRHCPFHPDGVVPEFTGPHPWRKPNPGMLLDLMKTYPVQRDRSMMIGDQDSDVAAAENAGIKGLKFTGGNLYDFAIPALEKMLAQ